MAVPAMLVGSTGRRPALAHFLWVLMLVKLLTPPLFHLPLGHHSRPAQARRSGDAPHVGLAVDSRPVAARQSTSASERTLAGRAAPVASTSRSSMLAGAGSGSARSVGDSRALGKLYAGIRRMAWYGTLLVVLGRVASEPVLRVDRLGKSRTHQCAGSRCGAGLPPGHAAALRGSGLYPHQSRRCSGHWDHGPSSSFLRRSGFAWILSNATRYWPMNWRI